MTDSQALINRISELEHRLALLEDEREIARLQNIYGFYLDNRMWGEIAALFCEDGEIEIGRRGGYRGRVRVRRFLEQVLGQGRWGLLENEIIHHIQLQMVITIALDRQTAQMRSRALIQGNSPPGQTRMLLAEGLYENAYCREAGRWMIKRLWWVPTYYFTVPGFETAVFESGPASDAFPPDTPPRTPHPGLGRDFPPFHYAHPFTDAPTPIPTSGQQA
jgi:hypothetical protein